MQNTKIAIIRKSRAGKKGLRTRTNFLKMPQIPLNLQKEFRYCIRMYYMYNIIAILRYLEKNIYIQQIMDYIAETDEPLVDPENPMINNSTCCIIL